MLSSRQRRIATRIWITLSLVFFIATCADRLKPYLKGIAGARDGGAQLAPRAKPGSTLRLGSWNLHWLDLPGRGHDHRGASDYEALRRYAQALDADVIAVQEVASEEALALVFPRDQFAYYLAGSGGPQRAGFVVRRSVQVQAHEELRALALETLRGASDITVRIGGQKLRMLSVHLKAFCVSGSLLRRDKDCEKLRAQLPILEGWIDARAREGAAFVVLGDFNRALTKPGDELLRELDDGEPRELSLKLASMRTHSACHEGKRAQAIDHMLLGGPAIGWMSLEGQLEIGFSAEDVAAKHKLSDHCPIRITLAPPVAN